MTPPETIHFSQIDLGERGRTEYRGIEQLAASVEDNGLIQPLVLVPLCPPITHDDGASKITWPQTFGLDAGGRRYHALQHLLSEGKWDGVLHHGSTSEKGRPGYVLKGADQATPLARLKTEIAENLDRDDMDWRDEMKLLVKAWRLARAEDHLILMRDYGAMLGCGYADLQAAVAVYEDVVKNPERYVDVVSVRGAYSKLLRENEKALTKIQAEKSLIAEPPVRVQGEPKQEGGDSNGQNATAGERSVEVGQPRVLPTEAAHIPLTRSFKNRNGIEFMSILTDGAVDHIYTDPDYAIAADVLESNSGSAGEGVHQVDVAASLNDLQNFITEAARVIKPQGFLIFWYDLDHHNRLQDLCKSVGFAVQRWPLIWHVLDRRSNAAPAHNFAKNVEYAMVCRKPNAVLARAQTSCHISLPSVPTVKAFHHPFAKPLDLHKWILSAIAIKGQIVLDPFAGSCSIPCACIEWGARPLACEVNPDHYNNGLMNMQRTYRKLLSHTEVTFS